MAKRSGIGAELYFDGYDLSGDIGAIDNLSSPRTTFDKNGLTKSSMERIYGKTDGQMSVTSHFNDACGQEHCAFSGLTRCNVLAMTNIRGCVGSPTAMLTARQINYDGTRTAEGDFTFAINAQGNGAPLEWGTVLVTKTTICAAGNSPSVNNCAASCNGVMAMLHVTAFCGTNLCVVLQESSDDGCLDCFATIASFAQVTAAHASERQTVTGAVEQYLRLNYSGTFTSATLVAGHRRGTANDIEGY